MLIRLIAIPIGLIILSLVIKSFVPIYLLFGWIMCWLFSFWVIRDLEKKLTSYNRRKEKSK